MIKRQERTRFKLRKISKRNRLTVFRSNNHLYAQIIDDQKGVTIASSSSVEKEIREKNLNRKELAQMIGKEIAKKSMTKGVNEVAFDKGKYKYHGIIKILADAARNEGLNFWGNMFENEKNELSEHLVTINRVAKVVKGGRRFGFAAIMIVGDNKGRVGVGTGKAKEVPEAVRKATENAKTKMIRVHLKDNRTIHHDIVGRFGAGKVILRAAAPGTGIIAGGPMRALFESLGLKDIVAKSTGTSNPHNMLKATFNAFKMSESPKSVASKRSKKITEINNKNN